MKKITLLVISLGIFIYFSNAQDPEFSQFYAAPVYLNPALAGTGKCSRVSLNLRDQWPNVEDPWIGSSHAYQTYSVSYDHFLDKINSGIGVNFFGDRTSSGVFQTHAVNAMYAYRININDQWNIQAALQGAIYQRTLNSDQLVFADQLDPRSGFTGNPSQENISSESTLFPDFSAGLFAFSDKYYGGFAIKHLTEPDRSFSGFVSELPMRVTVHGGATFDITEGTANNPGHKISTDVLFSQQTNFRQVNLGAFWNNGMFLAGLWGRLDIGKYNIGDAIIPRVGFQKDFFMISYSYDLTVSSFNQIGVFHAGAHELAIQFKFCGKQRRTLIYCPRF